MQKVRLDLRGRTALLMHNDTLADPLHPQTKEFKRVSSKRTKTDADHEEMARMEFLAGLYYEDGAVGIPTPNIMRCLIEGARVTKEGPKVERGVTLLGIFFPLEYQGPRTPEELYADSDFVDRATVRVGTARTVRVRPIFRRWALSVEALIDPSIIGAENLAEIAQNAGALIGLGEHRKGGGYGRFDAAVVPM